MRDSELICNLKGFGRAYAILHFTKTAMAQLRCNSQTTPKKPFQLEAKQQVPELSQKSSLNFRLTQNRKVPKPSSSLGITSLFKCQKKKKPSKTKVQPSYLALGRAILMAAVLPYHHSLTRVCLDKLSLESMLRKQDGNKVITHQKLSLGRQILPMASILFLKRIVK